MSCGSTKSHFRHSPMLQYAIHFPLTLQYLNKYHTLWVLLLWPCMLVSRKYNKVTYLADKSCSNFSVYFSDCSLSVTCICFFNTFPNANGVVSWTTWERRAGLVQTPLWLTVACCCFSSKLQPDVEQNSPEIKTAYEARRFKAKQDSWPTVTWHVRW